MADDWRAQLSPGFRRRYLTYLIIAIHRAEVPLSESQRHLGIAGWVEYDLYGRAANTLEYVLGIYQFIERLLTRQNPQPTPLLVRPIGPNSAPTNPTVVNTARSVGQDPSSDIHYFPPQVSEQARNQTYNSFRRTPGASTSTRGYPPLIAENIGHIITRLASSQAYTASFAGLQQNHQELLARIQASMLRVVGPRDETSQRINQMRERYVLRLFSIYQKLVGTSKQGLAEAGRPEQMRIMTTLNRVISSLLATEFTPLSRETLDSYERDIFAFINEYQ